MDRQMIHPKSIALLRMHRSRDIILMVPRGYEFRTATKYQAQGIIRLSGHSGPLPVYRDVKNRYGLSLRTNPVVALLLDIVPEIEETLTDNELILRPRPLAILDMLVTPEAPLDIRRA